MRNAVLRLVLLVLLLHAVMIVIYRVAGIERMSSNVRLVFVTMWTVATLAVVLPMLRRVRQERDRALGRKRGARPPGR